MKTLNVDIFSCDVSLSVWCFWDVWESLNEESSKVQVMMGRNPSAIVQDKYVDKHTHILNTLCKKGANKL